MLKPFIFRNRFAETGFLPVTGYRKAYCERDNCHRSLAPRLLSVDRLLLHGGRGPHSRRTDADAAKQRTVAYLSGRGRGNRCFCHRELITIVTPLSFVWRRRRPCVWNAGHGRHEATSHRLIASAERATGDNYPAHNRPFGNQ